MKHQVQSRLVWLTAITLSVITTSTRPHTTDEPAQAPPTLQDFSRQFTTSVEFKYSPEINNHPALVERLAAHTDEIVYEWLDENMGNFNPSYSISYELATQSPYVVTVLSKGSAYIGGLHDVNVTEAHTRLPEKQQWLIASALIDHPEGWQALSDYVCDNLYEQVSAPYGATQSRLHQESLASHRDWINRGAGPDAENFKHFQPLVSDDGRIAALKFIFPPYQVGSWADGTWTVEVPASVLYPHIAEKYRDLFVTL